MSTLQTSRQTVPAPEAAAPAVEARRPDATWRDYVAIARPDHWIKHMFILPGIALALVLRPVSFADRWWEVLIGFCSAAAIASANYVINEWLDARHDAHHPTKSRRPAVSRRMSPSLVFAEYGGLLLLGLVAASSISWLFFAVSFTFLLSGIAYNVPPMRTKDRVFLDVLSESFNNPLRLTLGWAMIDGGTLPPGSLLLAYWMGGAFLMAIKRVAEYRTVTQKSGAEILGLYRRSFRFYTSESLLVSSFVYAQMAAFFLAVFLIKYRIEYLLVLPLFATLFGIYFRIGLAEESPAQTPERLFKQKLLMAMVAAVTVALALLTWIDIPVLERLTTPQYISVFN